MFIFPLFLYKSLSQKIKSRSSIYDLSLAIIHGRMKRMLFQTLSVDDTMLFLFYATSFPAPFWP